MSLCWKIIFKCWHVNCGHGHFCNTTDRIPNYFKKRSPDDSVTLLLIIHLAHLLSSFHANSQQLGQLFSPNFPARLLPYVIWIMFGDFLNCHHRSDTCSNNSSSSGFHALANLTTIPVKHCELISELIIFSLKVIPFHLQNRTKKNINKYQFSANAQKHDDTQQSIINNNIIKRLLMLIYICILVAHIWLNLQNVVGHPPIIVMFVNLKMIKIQNRNYLCRSNWISLYFLNQILQNVFGLD